MILQFKTSGSGDENGLGSKLYPSNILGMHNKGIIRFLQYAKMEQKPPLRNKSNSVDVNTYIKTGQVQRVLMVLYNTFVLLQKITHFVAIVTFSFVTIQLLTTSNLPVQWFCNALSSSPKGTNIKPNFEAMLSCTLFEK